MTRQCAYDPTCRRDPVPTSPDGTAHANCAGHEREAMSFFGESWHERARAGVLRPAIVGGLPLPSSGAVPGGESPLAVPQSAGALHHMRPTGLGDPDPADRECVSGPLQAGSPHHIQGRRLAHGNQGTRELATRSPRLCVELEQGAPSADEEKAAHVTRHPSEGARGQKPMGVPAVQRADALAGGSSASDPAASGRVIVRATPGPAAPVTRPDRPLSVVPSPPSPGVGSRGAEPAATAVAGG